MTESVVLDTSVAIAWYVTEDFSAAAEKWYEDLASGRVRFIVPSLHYWEFGNVLRSHVRSGKMAGDFAEQIYRTHLEAQLELVEPNRGNVLKRALEYHATMYDAVYIELALSLQVPLVTAERTTTPWVVKLGRLAHVVSAKTGRPRRH